MIFRFSTPQQVITAVYVLGGRTIKIYSHAFLKPRVTSTAGLWDNFAYILQDRNAKKKCLRDTLTTCKANLWAEEFYRNKSEVIRIEDAYTELNKFKIWSNFRIL
jgi:hypothetical protein